MGGWFLETYSVMTSSIAKGMNSIANGMNSITKMTNLIAKTSSDPYSLFEYFIFYRSSWLYFVSLFTRIADFYNHSIYLMYLLW